MKKLLLSLPIFLLFIACQNTPNETPDLSVNNTATKSNLTDSTAKWTRNVYDFSDDPLKAINYTDENNLKQGRWVTYKNGKTEYYKDGKIVKGGC